MISEKSSRGGQPEQKRLLAFHYRAGCEVWTPLAGYATVPALVYEVTRTAEEDGSVLYEGRIFDAATQEMIHDKPYRSTFLEAFARWWSRETELDPPEELLSHMGRDHERRHHGG